MGLFRGCIQSQAPFIIQISKGARKYTDKRMLEAIIRDRGRDLSGRDLRRPPRPRRRGNLLRLHQVGLLQLGHDRRLARAVRQECRDHEARRRRRPRQGPVRRGRARHARRRRGGHQGRGRARHPHQPGRGRGIRARRPAATRWPAPSAPATAPTSSRAASPSISTSCARSRPSCRASRSSCTARPRSRRRRSTGSTRPAARWPDAVGVDPNEYLPAAKLGVTKVNIDTDGRLVWTRVHREFFRDKPGEFDFRPPGKIFIEEYAKFIASRNEKLGSAGQLADLRRSLGK